MLKISAETIFGRGGYRDCHFHPTRTDRCLKVLQADKSLAQLRSVDPLYKRLRPLSHYDQNLRDFVAFQRFKKRIKGIASSPLPEVDGLVETTLGQALCMELIRDGDGNVSQSLKEFIMQNGFTHQARQSLDTLENIHLDCALLIRDPFPQNLVVQRLNNGRLRMLFIDGLGDSNVLPINRMFKPAARSRIAKKFRRLRKACELHHQRFHSGKRAETQGNGILLKRRFSTL